VEPEKTPRERVEDLISLLVSDWRPTLQQRVWAIRAALVMGVLVALGYAYGITLWDWAKLLIIPAVIAAGGFWFNAQQRKREHEVANEHAQDETLQAYLDQMSQLLTDEKRPLHRAQLGDSLSTVARARTLTALSRLDGERKASVVQFLYEAELIIKDHTVISLAGADLREAKLRNADLHKAALQGADLREADLRGALLMAMYLFGGSQADLQWAKLQGANLEGAMTFPHVLEQQGARLEGATMPNGQKYEDWLKNKGRGDE
jgi:Pentapeptide repeats (8 copies)